METKIDWVTLLLYAAILVFGWMNIYAACYDEAHTAILDLHTMHGKQLLWIGISVVIALIITHIDPHIFSSMSYLIYLVVIGLSVVVLFLGTVTKGGL